MQEAAGSEAAGATAAASDAARGDAGAQRPTESLLADELLVDRVEYLPQALPDFEIDAVPNPLELFRSWLAEAVDAGLPEPNAATLATADQRGRPSARIVLVKSVDAQGARFYTNLRSRKGRELQANPHGALLFGWIGLHRQVRIAGTVHRLTREQSESYFATRPRDAQLGAWASQQSEEVSRAELEERFELLQEHFAQTEHIPMPDFWGGYLLVPDEIEFWVGRRSRLHDRIAFERIAVGGLDDVAAWRRRRLSP